MVCLLGACRRLPSFSLPCAIDVLTTGTYPRLPACIRVSVALQLPSDQYSFRGGLFFLLCLPALICWFASGWVLPFNFKSAAVIWKTAHAMLPVPRLVFIMSHLLLMFEDNVSEHSVQILHWKGKKLWNISWKLESTCTSSTVRYSYGTGVDISEYLKFSWSWETTCKHEKPRQHTINCLKKKDVGNGSGWQSILMGWKWDGSIVNHGWQSYLDGVRMRREHCQSDHHWNCFKGSWQLNWRGIEVSLVTLANFVDISYCVTVG